MIIVHPRRGGEVFLNADLIESIDEHPDTIITLVDGRRLEVSDDPAELADRIVRFRGSILASAERVRSGSRPSFAVHEGHGP